MPESKVHVSQGACAVRYPESKEEGEFLEKLLTNDMNQLSLEQKEKVLFDVHGIAPSREDPPSIEEKLEDLRQLLKWVGKKDAYEIALKQNPHYVSSREFLLMFLRSTSYDIEAASTSIVDHFKIKRELFGDGEILSRPIRQSDLGDEELKILQSGNQQILPQRDSAGRIVVVENTKYLDELIPVGELPDSMFRANWYFLMLQLQAEETQFNGIVWLSYDYTSNGSALKAISAIIHRLESSIPLRTVAGHHCFDNPEDLFYLNGLKFQLKGGERLRVFGHLETNQELAFKLQTYGIPVENGPMKADGTWSVSFHTEYLETVRNAEAKESLQSPSKVGSMAGIVPTSGDVLLGRSMESVTHVGNQKLNHLVEENFDAYAAAKKHEKTKVAWQIFDIFQEAGGRFLKRSKEFGWTQVSDLEAREKISHSFRHYRSKMQKKENGERASKKRMLEKEDAAQQD